MLAHAGGKQADGKGRLGRRGTGRQAGPGAVGGSVREPGWSVREGTGLRGHWQGQGTRRAAACQVGSRCRGSGGCARGARASGGTG